MRSEPSSPTFIAIAAALATALGLVCDEVRAADRRDAVAEVVCHRSTSAPRIDASADDPAWQIPPMITAFTICGGPQGKGLSPLPTELFAQWDDGFLYLRFICHGGKLYSPHGDKHDAMHSEGDVAEVFIDAVGDQRAFIELQISPAGGVLDSMHLITADPKCGPDGLIDPKVISTDAWFDLDWNMAGLRSAAKPLPNGNGWIADLALPAAPVLKRLGMKQFKPMTLRANFLRYDMTPPAAPGAKPTDIVFMNWSPVPWGRPHRAPGAMGTVRLVN